MGDRKWGHDELQHDLAEARRACGEIVAEKLGLGSFGGIGQMDVAAMRPSWTNPNQTCYEVKVSRADFLADSQCGKYMKYLPYVRRLYFAVPAGLITKAEVPDGTGLIVRGANGWSVSKAPRINTSDPAKWPVFLQALLMKDHPDPRRGRIMGREARIGSALAQSALEHREAYDAGRFRGITLSRRVLDAFASARNADRRIEEAAWDLAHALGQSVNDRTLAQLVREVLAVRPMKPGPDLTQVGWAIKGAIAQLERAHARIEATAGEMDVAGAAAEAVGD